MIWLATKLNYFLVWIPENTYDYRTILANENIMTAGNTFRFSAADGVNGNTTGNEYAVSDLRLISIHLYPPRPSIVQRVEPDLLNAATSYLPGPTTSLPAAQTASVEAITNRICDMQCSSPRCFFGEVFYFAGLTPEVLY